MARLRFTYDAPRWAKFSGFAKRLALYCDVECKVEVTKGWLTEIGTVVCNGTDENVIKFKDKFELAIREYNHD